MLLAANFYAERNSALSEPIDERLPSAIEIQNVVLDGHGNLPDSCLRAQAVQVRCVGRNANDGGGKFAHTRQLHSLVYPLPHGVAFIGFGIREELEQPSGFQLFSQREESRRHKTAHIPYGGIEPV